MQLSELRRHWNDFGKQDPLWAILTRDDARGGRWSEDAFFATGNREVAGLIEHLDVLHLPNARRRALDFGCGVGRITQALCGSFGECEGVDIAPSMVNLARRYNRHGARCRYFVNATPDLQRFADERFDLVYSNLVLQHMRPEFIQRYVEEFIRVVGPEGIAVFQIPAERNVMRGPSTPAVEALPDTAFAACVAVSASSLEVAPAIGVPLAVSVRNTGTETWPARGVAGDQLQVNLGNHWWDGRGHLIALDDARAHLPHDLRPLEEAIVELVVTTPPRPGRYLLELDMVQEGVAWFGSKGADTTRIPVSVRRGNRWLAALRRCSDWWAGRRAAAQWPVSPSGGPRMEMYGVGLDTVLGWVTNAGARLVDLQIVEAAGAWPSFFYYVTKSRRQAAVDHHGIVTSLRASILPPVAFQARIEVAAPPRVVDGDTELSLAVTIRNLSPITWPGAGRLGRHAIKVGNHWFDNAGQLLVGDDGRATLGQDLGPGEETTLVLAVKVPATTGPHILELDLVQEHVAWFNAFGSGTKRIRVLVR